MSSGKEESYSFDLELEKEYGQPLVKSEVEELLRLQLTEYDMLQSMFPSPGELSVDDHSVFVNMNEYLNGDTSEIPQPLDYTINLNVEEHKLEVCVTLPLEYPKLEPDIFLRSNDLNRNQQRALNNALANYISTLPREEICILLAVSWVQENALEYFVNKNNENTEVKVIKKDDSFSRFWIYSHHIYSKIKCRAILDLAEDYQLTGFCLPGKPGIICLEGYSNACQEWWQKVKSMNWKKITCKKVEETKLDSVNIEQLRKFPDFRAISFQGDKGKKLDHHMDFGQFYKYLKDHQCEYIFKECFGVEGK